MFKNHAKVFPCLADELINVLIMSKQHNKAGDVVKKLDLDSITGYIQAKYNKL